MSEAALPASYHILWRGAGEADFKRAGTAWLTAQPERGTVIEVACGERRLRGVVEAVFIPPGCEENCVGTVFLAES